MKLGEMISGFASAMKEWIANGAPIVSEDQYKERAETCLACPHWDQDAYAGKGKCLKCCCSGVKLYLATSSCPIKKWMAVTPPLPDATVDQLKRCRNKNSSSQSS